MSEDSFETDARKRPFQFRISSLLLGMAIFSLLAFHFTTRYRAEARIKAIDDKIDLFLKDSAKPIIQELRPLPNDEKIDLGRDSNSSFNGFIFQESFSQKISSFLFQDSGVRDEHVFFISTIRLPKFSYRPTVSIGIPTTDTNFPNAKFNDPVIKELKRMIKSEFDIEVDIIEKSLSGD